jgi:hypothetical protein
MRFNLLQVDLLAAMLLIATAPALARNDSSGGGESPRVEGRAPVEIAAAASLTNQQADSGIREALRVAAQHSVSLVGRTDGYYKDPAIHVPLPGFLKTAKKGLAMVGASGMLDDLELRMNRAAEEAAPKAYDIFADAISKMTVTDAKEIVTGPNDAATQYLKRTSSPQLIEAFRPIVDKALADAGAVKAYNATMDRLSSGSGVGGLLGGGAKGAAGFDLTGFVVQKALDGLFYYIGKEEGAIRTNPVERTTDILKQVFGR